MYLSQNDTGSIIRGVKSLKMGPGQVMCILLAEKNHPDLKGLVTEIQGLGVPFFGGIFPGLIHDGKKYDQGAILAPIKTLGRPLVFSNLEEEDPAEFYELPLITGSEDRDFTILILADGLARGIGKFLNGVFNHLGHGVHYFGGGAGSLSLKPQPCLFTENGVFQNAAVVVCADISSRLGVRHGWQVLYEPLVATRTDGNRILEINWENAFSVYRTIVEEDSGQLLTRESFTSIASSYPFGMYRDSAEEIIRDPVMLGEAGSLICMAEIPENSTLTVMKGVPEKLINAAGKAGQESLKSLTNDGWSVPGTQLWMADCVSRALFLGEKFSNELKVIKDQACEAGIGSPVKGALTLGEISSHGDSVLELLNKTAVVGVFNAK